MGGERRQRRRGAPGGEDPARDPRPGRLLAVPVVGPGPDREPSPVFVVGLAEVGLETDAAAAGEGEAVAPEWTTAYSAPIPGAMTDATVRKCTPITATSRARSTAGNWRGSRSAKRPKTRGERRATTQSKLNSPSASM